MATEFDSALSRVSSIGDKVTDSTVSALTDINSIASNIGVTWSERNSIDSFIADLDVIVNRDWTPERLEASFIRDQKELKDHLEKNDIDGINRWLLTKKLEYSQRIQTEALRALTHNFDVTDFACCLITSLASIDGKDGISAGQLKTVQDTRRMLVVIKTVLLTVRKTLEQSLFLSAIKFSLNIVGMIAEMLDEMFTSLFTSLTRTIYSHIMQKLMSSLTKTNSKLLLCFGFLRLIKALYMFLVNSVDGFINKWRSKMYMALLKLQRDNALAIKQLQVQANLSVIDILVKIINSLIEAIDAWQLCSPNIYSQYTPSANLPNRDTSTDEFGTNTDTENAGDVLANISVSGDQQSGSGNGSVQTGGTISQVTGKQIQVNTSYGVPVVDASRLFNEPTADELERFLTHYLAVPQAEARVKAIASVQGNCADKLSAQSAQRVAKILTKLGL